MSAIRFTPHVVTSGPLWNGSRSAERSKRSAIWSSRKRGLVHPLRRSFVRKLHEQHSHYREATGTDLWVDYNKAIQEDQDIKSGFEAELAGAQADIERLHDGTTTSFKVSSSKARLVNSATENWQKALGGHRIWGTGDVTFDPKTCQYKLELKVEMEDFYNFNKGQADIATGLPDDENGRFEVFGWAKSFYSRAIVTRTITWKRGSIDKTTKVAIPPGPPSRKR